MEPKQCETCGLNPALPGADECSICLLGYDSAEAKKTEWKPLLGGVPTDGRYICGCHYGHCENIDNPEPGRADMCAIFPPIGRDS